MNKILVKIAASAGAPASVVALGLVSVIAKAALNEVVAKYAHEYFRNRLKHQNGEELEDVIDVEIDESDHESDEEIAE